MILKLIHTSPLLSDFAYAWLRGWHRARAASWARKRCSSASARKWKIDPSYLLCVGTTNQCNAKCVFCAHDKVDAKRGFMDEKMFENIARNWRAFGGRRIDFTVGVGEPTLDKLLLSRIAFCVDLGLETSFTTNATLMQRDSLGMRLLRSGLKRMFVSMDIAEGYWLSYGTHAGKQVAQNVADLIKANRAYGNPVELVLRFRSTFKPSQIIRSPWYQENVVPFFGKTVQARFTPQYDDWGGIVKAEDLVGDMRFAPIFKKPRIPCRQLVEPAVNYNGDIILCACRSAPGVQDLVVGNVRDMKIEDALKTKRAGEIREGFLRGEPPPICRDCTLYRPL